MPIALTEIPALPLPPDPPRGVRMRLARSWPEFLTDTVRTLAGVQERNHLEVAGSRLAVVKSTRMFDRDAAGTFNFYLPLSLWWSASSDPGLPAYLQSEIASARWVRALILNRPGDARRFAERWVALRPEDEALVKPFLEADTEPASRFAAVFSLLRNSRLQPLIRSGWEWGRWWITPYLPDRTPGYYYYDGLSRIYPRGVESPRFLNAQERAQGDAELDSIQKKAGAGPNFLCGEALTWAALNPGDRRVPEALHLCVKRTREENEVRGARRCYRGILTEGFCVTAFQIYENAVG